jgi:hypothetical protein
VFKAAGLGWNQIISVVTDLGDLAVGSGEVWSTVADSLVTKHYAPTSILTHLILAFGSLAEPT